MVPHEERAVVVDGAGGTMVSHGERAVVVDRAALI
jgi:dethiobiotin synthetase